MGNTFTLGFGNKIGKNVTLVDDSEYYCGDYISGRFYTGKFKGTVSDNEGIWFLVDEKKIKIGNTTKITFDD